MLAFTRYGRMGATSRVRMFQYLEVLSRNGINVRVSPLTEDAMLAKFYTTGRRARISYMKVMASRLRVLLSAHRYDLVWMEKELFPYAPAWAERYLGKRGVRYVVDFDDATFHNYDNHRNRFVRRLFGEKIPTVMRMAEAVFVGNGYLAEYASGAGAKKIAYLPTVVDLERYTIPLRRDRKEFRIGWIGTPFTTKYLSILKDVFSAVELSGNCRLILVGAGPVNITGVSVEVQPWSERTEVEQIQQFDVGIMPLVDEPIERGKCGYKLIQCMACGLPVVASPVGANCTIVEHGATGFLAGNTDEWIRWLSFLKENVAEREAMGKTARARVEKEFSLQVTGPRFAGTLRGILDQQRNDSARNGDLELACFTGQ